MPEMTHYAPGTPSWVDIATTDVPGAKAFYSAVFGWTFEAVPGGNGYETATLGRGPLAGLMRQTEEMAQSGAPPSWTTFVTVDDLDGAAAAVASGGGSVVMGPMEVMDIGRMLVLQDPAGAVLALWEPTGLGGAAVVNEHGAFAWADLVTPDVPGAAAFYQGVLAWSAVEMTDPMGNPSRMFTVAGRPVASARSQEGVPPHWAVYFAVDDADAGAAAITANGGTIHMGPMDTPPGRMVVASDPAGAAFCVIQLDPEFDPLAS